MNVFKKYVAPLLLSAALLGAGGNAVAANLWSTAALNSQVAVVVAH